MKVRLFGARALARQQAITLATTQVEFEQARMRIAAADAELGELRNQNAAMQADIARLGVADVVALERQRDQLREQVAREKREAAAQATARAEATRIEIAALETRLGDLREQVVITEETAVLQEVGVYEYQHPLSDSVAYKIQLADISAQIKQMTRADGGAITGTMDWRVNGSEAKGRKMVREFSKLMLRAYNAEADTLIRGLKPYKLHVAKDRLTKARATIERLGQTMSIQVTPLYHQLRITEMELTADYLEMVAEEKAREREERERLREERKAQQEIERERQRLEKEKTHYSNALMALEAKGDAEAAERMRSQLADIERAIEDVDYRAANARAGYVYVISNLGSFGEGMVKIGMTRRLDPKDRISELSDASVPFNFDIHALFFSDDAVEIETQMHRRLAHRRVNKVNLRREFFYATPAEARELLSSLAGDLLTFEDAAEAVEYRQSRGGDRGSTTG